jgi:hypothetical protein
MLKIMNGEVIAAIARFYGLSVLQALIIFMLKYRKPISVKANM